MKIKAALTASLGGAFEWYDFIIYGFFIQVFGHQFYPVTNIKSESLTTFFSIVAVGFFARPLGGLVFGHIGDVYGRSRALYYSMILIGVATFCVAIMPTYNQVGGYSTIIFIILRICQGFAIGGSISGSFIYISELSEPDTRSFWVTTTFIGAMRGIIFAAVISTFLINYLTYKQLHDWGWRLAFLFGSLILIIARYYSGLMVETPYHEKLAKNKLIKKYPIHTLFKENKVGILQCIGFTAIHSVLIIFILLFMPTFLQNYGMGHKDALNVNIITIMTFSTLLPLFGWFGNKASLHTMYIIACILTIIFIIPILHMMVNHNILIRICGILILTILNCMISAAIPPIIVGLFPTDVRYCGVSFSYNLCVAIFAGVSPMLTVLVGHQLHSLISGTSVVIIIAAVVSFISALTPRKKHMPIAVKRFTFHGLH